MGSSKFNFCEIPIAKAFPNLEAPEGAIVEALEDVGHPLVPVVQPMYKHSKSLVVELRLQFMRPFSEGLLLVGHSGTGKTSGVLQYCAATRRPVRSITVGGSTTADDLIGNWGLLSGPDGEQPSMQFMYGPLSLAMKNGEVLLINEIDMVPPSELAVLNDVLDGRPLIIEKKAGGECIVPHPNFRVVATANTKGGNDDTGAYTGVQYQNAASMDRWSILEIDYPTPEVELSILEAENTNIPAEILELMVKVAKETRKLFVDGEISKPMTTRSLCRWVKKTFDYRNAQFPMAVAFEIAFSNALPDAEKIAMNRLAHDIVGFPI